MSKKIKELYESTSMLFPVLLHIVYRLASDIVKAAVNPASDWLKVF